MIYYRAAGEFEHMVVDRCSHFKMLISHPGYIIYKMHSSSNI